MEDPTYYLAPEKARSVNRRVSKKRIHQAKHNQDRRWQKTRTNLSQMVIAEEVQRFDTEVACFLLDR